jgi:hypothetical protein
MSEFVRNRPIGRLHRALDVFLAFDWQIGHAGQLTDLAERLRDVANQIEVGVERRLDGSDAERTAEELSA